MSGSRKHRLLLILAILCLCVAGQFMLQGNHPLFGAILAVLAAIFFVVLFRDQDGPGKWLAAAPMGRQLFKLNLLGKTTLVLAILFASLAFWLFGKDIPEYYPWLLHQISIGLLVFSSFWLNKSEGVSASLADRKKWNLWEIGSLIAILIIAAFMRLHRLNEIPFGLWYDEADNGLSALAILRQSEYLPVFVKSTNLPAHFLYLIALSFQTFGVSVLAIRRVSVAFGLATVLASFFLGSELFNRRLGLVLAFFLAVSRWDVNWSRIGMHGVSVPFFEILSAVLSLWALRKQNLVLYTLAGLSLGLGLCFYTPLYFFLVVMGVFLLFLWLRKHDLFHSTWRGFLFLALGAVVVSVPISQFALHQPDSFSDRLSVTSIFTGKSTQEAWNAIARTTREHFLMFNYHGDNNGRHNLPGEPMLDPISGAFMVLGAALSLWRIRQPGSFLFIIWLLIMLLPGILSLDFESPQSLRAIGSLPPAYLLAVVPIHALWQEWEQSSGKYPIGYFILPLFVFLGAAGYNNYHVYFDLQSRNSASWNSFSTPQTIAAKEITKLGTQTDVYLGVFYYNSPTIKFLAPETIIKYHLLETYDALPIQNDGGKTMVFFVDAEDQKSFFIQARRYYPNAGFKEYKDPDGNTVLYQITLNPPEVEASQGIVASYYRNADWQAQPFLVKKESTVSADWENGEPSQFPFGVKWQGVLCADQYGAYSFTLHSPSPSELYLDNVQVYLEQDGEGKQTAKVELAKGCHDLVIKTTGQEGHFELDWQSPGVVEQVPIPSSHLFLPPISNNGLLGRYFANDEWQGPPAIVQVDPWIHFFYYTQLLPVPFTAEWVGRINITEAGRYGFKLESVDESILFIDDKPVVSRYKEGAMDLSPGFHLFRLRYVDRAEYAYVNLYWSPPGSGWESIPQEALFLP
jgi:4-amino-4-deoxy-L-arabinose transferase-like glycosyltransferase